MDVKYKAETSQITTSIEYCGGIFHKIRIFILASKARERE